MLRPGVLRRVTSTPTGPTYREATPADIARVRSLLAASDLPLDGLPETLSGFAVAELDGELVGVAGVEECGDYGLLRSAAVDPSVRGMGIGRELVQRVIVSARNDNRKALYLLTTTAENYFPAFGFEKVDRAEAPDPIRGTAEFTSACPASATFMKLELP